MEPGSVDPRNSSLDAIRLLLNEAARNADLERRVASGDSRVTAFYATVIRLRESLLEAAPGAADLELHIDGLLRLCPLDLVEARRLVLAALAEARAWREWSVRVDRRNRESGGAAG